MAVQKAVAISEYINKETGDINYHGGGGGGGGYSTSKTSTKTTNSNTIQQSSNNYKNTNISSSHPLFPGIIGTNSQCALLPNKQLYIIDGNKLTGESATYFNNGKVWHTHFFNNTTYELVYHNNTYWYKIKGVTAKTSSNNVALESLLKITEVLKNSLSVEENSIIVDETQKETIQTTPKITSYVKPVSYTYTNSYIKTKTILPKNKNTTIEIVKNNLEVINKEDKKSEINFNDLISKGKLSFQTKVNVSYSYAYNLVNIVPNPLYNDLINDKYNDELYATGDLNGETNTTYLKLNKQNIVNNISKNYYLPSIGELGISMENIQIINDSIDALGEEYSDCKIPYDAIIASSTLYSSIPVSNDNYHITNNLNNVWCFNNKEAEISYKPISNKFTIIPFYKFKNNMVINLDEEIEDVVINSILTINLASSNYYETNSPIHNFKVPSLIGKNKATDFNTSNWLEHPFSSKYFFNILFPEVQDYISLDDNFTNLHDDYLSYYIYHSEDSSQFLKDLDMVNKYNIKIAYSSTKPIYSYYNIENNTYCKNDIRSNNGISLPPYLGNHVTYTIYGSEGQHQNDYWVGKTKVTYSYIAGNGLDSERYSYYMIDENVNDFWKRYLIYNTIIYGNHIVLMPIIGSGENNYNFKKNKAKVLLYVTVPSFCTNFTCKMNNTTDCDIYSSKYETIKGFDIYCIELYFKVDSPTDNVLIFSCKYQNQIITKKYFYSIYSLTMSGILDNKNTTYFNIENYYVAKDPYYWWNINKWDKLYNNWEQSKYINYSYYIENNQSKNYATVYSYVYYDGFGKLFDASYNITNIRFVAYYDYGGQTRFSYATFDKYTKTSYLQPKFPNEFSYLSYSYFNIMYDMSYMINHIGRNIGITNSGTVQEHGLRVDRLIDNDVTRQSKIFTMDDNGMPQNSNSLIFNNHNNNNKSLYFYQEFNPNHDYHIFTINTYFNNILSGGNYQMNRQHTMNSSDRIYKPIVRINRTVDDFGVYDDLIFSYLTSTDRYKHSMSNTDNIRILTTNGEISNFGINALNYEKYDYIDSKPSTSLVWDVTEAPPYGASVWNTFNLNTPIVGAKQSICWAMDMVEYLKKGIFKNSSKSSVNDGNNTIQNFFYYYNYVFSDYLFLYNNTNGVVTLLMSDPSLSLISKQHALIQLKPKELKLYYPNNFNYSVVSNYDIIENDKIYDIKLVNKTSNIKNIIFDHYQFGELNNSFESLKSNNKKLCYEKGFRLITHLMYLYKCYINGEFKNSDTPYIYFNDFYSRFNGVTLEERKNIYSKHTNEINVGIKNYNQNKAGHFIVINTNKVMKEDIFYKNFNNNQITFNDKITFNDTNQVSGHGDIVENGSEFHIGG